MNASHSGHLGSGRKARRIDQALGRRDRLPVKRRDPLSERVDESVQLLVRHGPVDVAVRALRSAASAELLRQAAQVSLAEAQGLLGPLALGDLPQKLLVACGKLGRSLRNALVELTGEPLLLAEVPGPLKARLSPDSPLTQKQASRSARKSPLATRPPGAHLAVSRGAEQPEDLISSFPRTAQLVQVTLAGRHRARDRAARRVLPRPLGRRSSRPREPRRLEERVTDRSLNRR